MNTYVFDQGWQKEHDRLAGIESLYDSYSTQRLAGLGVREGWHAWRSDSAPAASRCGWPGRWAAPDGSSPLTLTRVSLTGTAGPTWTSASTTS